MKKEWRYRSRGGPGIFMGFVIIAVGVIFLLNNLGFIGAQYVFRVWFWPALLILFGFIQLARWGTNR